jgi:hypothetical protein
VETVLATTVATAAQHGRSPLLIDAVSALVALSCRIYPFCTPRTPADRDGHVD